MFFAARNKFCGSFWIVCGVYRDIISYNLAGYLFLQTMAINLGYVFSSVGPVLYQGDEIFSSDPLNRFFADVVIDYGMAAAAYQEKTEFSIFNTVLFFKSPFNVFPSDD